MSPSLSQARGWCSVLLAALPVDHVAISTLQAPFETAVVAASDELARALTERQLDLGVGQSWDALRSRAPVLQPRLSAGVPWPATMAAMTQRGIASSYAFPMTVGLLGIGAIDLYAVAADALSRADVLTARGLTATVTLQVLRDALQDVDDRDAPAAAGQRAVHQATGMVMAQVQATATDALLLIRGRAFAEGVAVGEMAKRIVERRVTFAEEDG